MKTIDVRTAALASACTMACLASLSASAQVVQAVETQAAPPDSALFAMYSFNPSNGYVGVDVCGSVPGSTGCYGGGGMGPFGHVGALIEGNAAVNRTTNTVSRHIYVVDQSVGGGASVSLSDYHLIEQITPPYANITVKLLRSIPLPLTGGASAKTFLAADDRYLFIGTNQGASALKIAKSGLAISILPGFSPPINVSSMTANQRGFVAVTYGGTPGNSGFAVYGPDGSLVESGGGANLLLDSSIGVSTSNAPWASPTSAIPAGTVRIRFTPAGTPPAK